MLDEHAMLVSLNISQWTARKFDKKTSEQINNAKGAKDDAGRYNKHLLGHDVLGDIASVVGAARQYLYDKTLPWGDNGQRLLPAALFMDFTSDMRNFRAEFERRVKDFIKEYPNHKAAARLRLGALYDPTDYPDDSEIAFKFSFAVNIDPVPSANDFRVDLSREHLDYIRREIEERERERQTEALKHVWSRVRDVVERIHVRMSADKPRIFDSMIDDARELISVLPALNITNDPALNKIAQEIDQILVHPDKLRVDPTAREEIAKRAGAILNQLNFGA